MRKIIDLGYDTVGILDNANGTFAIYCKFMSPSYQDENVYFPAESIHMTLVKEKVIELRDMLDEFVEQMTPTRKNWD